MTLRLKFVLLIAGVLVIPYIALVLIVSLNFYISGMQVSLRSFIAEAEFIRMALQKGLDKDSFADSIPRTRETWKLIVTDDNGGVLYPREERGEKLDLTGRDLLRSASGEIRNIQIFPFRFTDGTFGRLVLVKNIRAIPFGMNRYLNLLLPLGLFLFTTAMSFFILRSINRSLTSLESATRRIAEGDLDFDLVPKGRDKIASLVHSFNAMKEKLKEEYARRSRFMMSISHDLKSPLASIEGYTAAIQDGYADTPDKLTQYLSIIEQKTGLLGSRISNLIEFIGKETDGWRANLEPVPVLPFLEEFDRIFQAEAALNNLAYASAIELPGSPKAAMDEALVLRAFDNISQNAIRYAKPGGKIRFTARFSVGTQTAAAASPGDIEIRFENEGDPIPEKDLHNLFEPFYRGGQARSTPGSGLGLSIVKSVLVSHGWSIDVSSSPEGLNVFRITIPGNMVFL